MMDFIHAQGVAAFGTRLRRLSERLDRDVREIYRAEAVEFEPRWFPVIVALDQADTALSVGDLARRIGITHAAVSQVRVEVERRGLVTATPDQADQRRSLLQLTEGGRALAEKLEPIWRAIAAVVAELCAEQAPLLLAQLDRFEGGLAERGLAERVRLTLETTPETVK